MLCSKCSSGIRNTDSYCRGCGLPTPFRKWHVLAMLIVFLGVLAFLVVLGGLVDSPGVQKVATRTPDATKRSALPPPLPPTAPIDPGMQKMIDQARARLAGTAPPQPDNLVVHRVVSTYLKGGREWKLVVISPKLSRDDLTSLAKQLHRKHPETAFHIFDDARRCEPTKTGPETTRIRNSCSRNAGRRSIIWLWSTRCLSPAARVGSFLGPMGIQLIPIRRLGILRKSREPARR